MAEQTPAVAGRRGCAKAPTSTALAVWRRTLAKRRAPTLKPLYVCHSQATCSSLFDRWHADEDKGLAGHDFKLYAKSQAELPRVQRRSPRCGRSRGDAARAAGAPPSAGASPTRADSQPLYSRVASKLAGARVQIRCPGRRHDWPRVQAVIKAVDRDHVRPRPASPMPAATAPISRRMSATTSHGSCTATKRDETSLRRRLAVYVLAHESNHLRTQRGRDAEAITECNALQTVRRTAELLGAAAAAREQAGPLLELDGEEPAVPRIRHPQDCRPGGPL